MNFKLFLEQSIHAHSEKLTLEETIDLLMSDDMSSARRALVTGNVLYRGIESTPYPYSLVSTESMNRLSKDTNNIYQLMYDSSKALVEFPSRSKSLICATEESIASIYGHTNLILPFNDTDVAVSGISDFLRQKISVGSESIDLDTLCIIFYKLFTKFNLDIKPDNGKRYTDIHALDSQFKNINFPMIYSVIGQDEIVFGTIRKKMFIEVVKELEKLPRESMITSFANKFMTPSNLDVKLVRFGNTSFGSGAKEAWFSGKCLSLNVGNADSLEVIWGLYYDYDVNIHSSVLKLFRNENN